MHRHDASTEILTQAVLRYAVDRVRLDPPPLDGPQSAQNLRAMAGHTITERGIGGLEALRVFGDVLAPACISVDHPRFLSFVPAAPTEAAILFDLVVGASSVYAGSWMEGAGAVFAENEALRWIADLAGLPPEAGGAFVSGGTAGNLSALIAARWKWRHDAAGEHDRTRGLMITSSGAHSSVAQAGRAMDADVITVPADETGRMHGAQLDATVEALDPVDRDRLFAVIATSGTTNAGVIDDLTGAADVSERLGVWFHVDGAYGGAGLVAPALRDKFAGIERADSFIVDPHKWLFAPFDCCALLYRDPRVAKAAHTQQAEYLDVLHDDDDWNPSDYAHHLSRRARGLPLWFSLATHGTAAYREAVETTLEVAHAGADLIRRSDHCELVVEPELSIVMFRRRGWTAEQYHAWSDAQLAAEESFVVATSWHGETVLRICLVNPLTTVDDLAAIIESLR
ncbi:glutamate/tyrosine decarboxylase-like PLP-dependent enzyme [Ilumatobacter fluminis]|uniref:Glutamate/tyrosine decarboxylase-like PLP-dependent enzyme n=1 Tax=Ilumatobacter fluminis TaxID=467091 RepID=A0A4R7HW07_9ACTN|nr:pyridoxal-dependent decarboxylase [Ilumatobacter fluminis]TDT15075.1 glutamate/tyrosine decarboxylase-like PLP-dependent enzyme [Ilumatobacter fluminis]